ncbi:MAG: lysophospholipase [Sphingomonadales bacterium]|nr:lysophospholipase [Sphingomonadales bacterium]
MGEALDGLAFETVTGAMADPPFDRRAVPTEARFSTWTASDGWRLRRIDWAQPSAAKARGSLLFAGGRGDFIEKYLEIQHHWFARGWNVTAFDWRGQGGSRAGVEGAAADSFDTMVDDLAGLAADWRGALPGPHAAIGHSMGGHLLLRGLAERALGVDAAVLVAPMLAINSAPVPPLAAMATASLMTAIGFGTHPAWHQASTPAPAGSLRHSILTGCAERYEDELWWWQREPGYNLGAPSWAWLKAAYESGARLTPERLARVTTPILLVGTDRDRLVSPGAIRRAALDLPHAELLMFPNAGHEILREGDEIRLAALARIDAFLDEHAR